MPALHMYVLTNSATSSVQPPAAGQLNRVCQGVNPARDEGQWPFSPASAVPIQMRGTPKGERDQVAAGCPVLVPGVRHEHFPLSQTLARKKL